MLGVIYRNYSFVDRVWSVTPVINVWIFLVYSPTPLSDAHKVLGGLVICWGMRLSFNFWRKGGYDLTEEDYRWKIVKE